jgi:general secretion pathway protein I
MRPAGLRNGGRQQVRRSPEAAAGFALLEVLLALALFALATMVLAGAYINVLNGLAGVKSDQALEQEMRWLRGQVVALPDRAEVERGGEIPTPDFGVAQWQARVTPSPSLADLFLVELTVALGDGSVERPRRELTERLWVLRPQWSEPIEREKLRGEARNRIEEDRRHRGVLSATPAPAVSGGARRAEGGGTTRREGPGGGGERRR